MLRAAIAAETIGIPAHKAAEAMRSGRMMLRDTSRDEPESHDRVLFAKLGLESIGIDPIPYAEGMHEAYWNSSCSIIWLSVKGFSTC